MITKEDIEELGWEYSGQTTEEWYDMPITIQPFNLTYRHLKLSYGRFKGKGDGRVRIIGYEYSPKSDEEELFIGKLISNNPKEELKVIMQQIGIV